jgi:CelD/BcsL family acetyltransferase involved in cellulose biosynthesis
MFHDFHYDVAGRLLERGQLRVSWMELDGSPAAAEYHVADAKATYAYQGGVDPDRLDEEPGRLSTILCLRAAIEEGHSQIDFLRGDEPYKAHWRATPHATFDYRVIPNRRLARLRGRVWNVADMIGDWARIGAEKVLG